MANEATEGYQERIGDAWIRYNDLSGNFIVTGQLGNSLGYACSGIQRARQMAHTINHWNRTGEMCRFTSEGAMEAGE